MARGIEKIQKKILGDAEATAKEIRDQARKKVNAFKKARKKEAAAYEEKFKERTALLVENYIQESMAQARLDVKKSLLAEREAIIKEAIQDALQSIDHKSKAYEEFLARIIKEQKATLHGKLTFTCSKNDQRLVEKLVEKYAKGAKVTTSTALTGGLLVEEEGGRRVDESLEALLKRKRDVIRQEIAKILGQGATKKIGKLKKAEE